MKKLIVLSVLIISARFLDVFTTYIGSPSLANEINPLVRYLNIGWLGIVIKNH